MSSESDLQSALKFIQMDNYISLVVVTAIVYDYVLNLSGEIDYVWRRPWTSVSTMYVVVRYIGLYWGIILGLAGSTFIPGPVTTCTVVFLVCSWAFPVFLAAADLVMILRVYALWDRSRKIFGILLFIYVPQIISAFVFTGVYFNPSTYFSVSIAKVLDFAYCNYTNSTTITTDLYFTLPRFVLSVLLLALALTRTLKESLIIYRETKRWQPSQLMTLLLRDGIFYFSMNVVFNTSVVLQYGPQYDFSIILLETLGFLPLCPLVPRFIINLRKLYDRDLEGAWRGTDIAFGMSSQSRSRRDGTGSAIAFAGLNSGESLAVERDADGSEAIQLKVVGECVRQV